jgi:hypothetical protein
MNYFNKFLYHIINKWTSFKSYKKGALSFVRDKDTEDILVLPPLIDRNFLKLLPESNDYFCVLLNDKEMIDYFLEIIEDNEDEKFYVFTSLKIKHDLSNLEIIDLDYDLFLKYLTYSKGYISTSNFYLISLAYWMGKPTFVVPDKNDYSELCNFITYINNEIAIGNKKEIFFDLFKRYYEFFGTEETNKDFKLWVLQTEKKILKLLT